MKSRCFIPGNPLYVDLTLLFLGREESLTLKVVCPPSGTWTELTLVIILGSAMLKLLIYWFCTMIVEIAIGWDAR
jgi:hypothetical protein